ncbi:PSL4 [Symbiodinium pilosum]|uniref:PSL4 protein n=1 Tax=Symbiodinium pilosum TaxID=2952 RepID=A0A812PYB9_SYMPI|nr:PSL4 [Symbiodinium pilosum]
MAGALDDEDDPFEEALKDEPGFPPDDDAEGPALTPTALIVAPPGCLALVPAGGEVGKPAVTRRWFASTKSPAERALQQAEDLHESVEKALKTARVRVEELEKKLKSGSEEWELPYSGLDGRCIEKSIGEYKYKICFFDNAKQDSTSVGRWQGWEAPGIASFTAGQYCPGGPERSLKVKFQCGSKEELIDVSEPSRCTYEAQWASSLG